MMINGVKGFAHVNGYCYGAIWRWFLVEPRGDDVVDFLQRSDGGMVLFETMLRVHVW